MGKLRAGMSQVVITPPVGVRLAGYAESVEASTEVLDELYAKALVLEDGGSRIAVVACDLLQLDRDMVSAVRRRIGQTVGIPSEAILAVATHTHSGPDLHSLDDATIDHLVAQIAGAVHGATIVLEDAQIGFGQGACSVGANRRFRDSPDGPYVLYNDPNGLADPRVMVMVVRSASGETRGGLVNYACHPVCLGHDLRISKDYVHFMCATLKDAWGEDAVPLFLQGCAGNINPRWIWDRPDLSPPPERIMPAELGPRHREMRRLGTILGAEAQKTAESIVVHSAEASLGAVARTVALPLRADMSVAMRESLRRAADSDASAHRRYGTFLRALAGGGTTYAAEVQVLRVGDGLIVGLPGEIFVEYQMEIRERLPGRPVFVAGLANDCVHYIPTPSAFREGGYEPQMSYFAPEAGHLLVEGVIAAVHEAGWSRTA